MDGPRANRYETHRPPCKDLLTYCLKRDTLIRYLLDELYLSEDDHSDALCPIQREAQVSLLGEHALVRPPTTEEVRLLHSELKFDVKHIEAEVGAMKQSFNSFASALNNFANSPSRKSISPLQDSSDAYHII